MMRRAWILIIFFFCLKASSNNPVISDIYTADPAVMVYNDTVFLYTGHDEAPVGGNGYVMDDWQLFTSTDMKKWTAWGEVLNVSEFSWAVGDAWAGEVEERDGKFYYYICAEHKTIPGKAIGVAVADNPYGPFKDAIGAALITNNMTTEVNSTWDDIDPTVFIDDDGQAYMYWGNSGCYFVKLKENMIEIDGDIQYIELPNFTEAPYIHKHDSTYYLSYAHGWFEKIAYATSKSITGPWEYKGIINDLVNNSNTNHQTIFEFKNQWFFVYHTGEIGGNYQRSVAAEYLFYNDSGLIVPITQTTEGVSGFNPECPPTPIFTQLKRNDDNWMNEQFLELTEGDSLQISTSTSDDGTWNWTGPAGFLDTTGNLKLMEVIVENEGVYLGTYTNSCGTKSFTNFELLVNYALPENLQSGKSYVIFPKDSELALSVSNNSKEDGAAIVQNRYNNGQNQIWKFIVEENEYWRVSPTSVVSKGMDVNNFSLNDGAKIQTWDYWGGTTQQWQLIERNDGYYQFRARHSGKCLDMTNTPQTLGASTQQWTCSDTSNSQLFSIVLHEEVEPPVTTSVKNNLSEKTIKIYPNPSTGHNLQIETGIDFTDSDLLIYDQYGRKVYQQKNVNATTRLDVNLTKGIYFVQLKNRETSIVEELVIW